MSNISHVGICLKFVEYEWLYSQLRDDEKSLKLLEDGAIQAQENGFVCPNDIYTYLYWDEIKWSEKDSPTKEIIDLLNELYDIEIIVVSENGEIEEEHSEEHSDMLTLIDNYCIDFDLAIDEG